MITDSSDSEIEVDRSGLHDPVLSLRKLSKSYGPTQALRDVSLELESGNVYGLIGVNGSGKSTLMKMVAGIERPTAGEMLLDGEAYKPRGSFQAGRMGVGFVPQELPVVKDVSVADNVLMGRWPTRFGMVRRSTMSAQVKHALGQISQGIDPQAAAGSLTLGEQQLMLVAKALSRHPRLLLLDEPTSALNSAEVTQLRRVTRDIAAEGRTVLIVSQRLDDVFEVCDHIMVLRNGELIESTTTDQLSPERAIELMLHGRDGTHGVPDPGSGATAAQPRSPGTAALEVRGFTVPGYEAAFDLRLERGEIVGLAGLPGAGTSEFMRALFGRTPTQARSIKLFGEDYRPHRPSRAVRAGVVYVTGDRRREGIVPESSMCTNITMAADRSALSGPRQLGRSRRGAQGLISRLKIRPGIPDVPVRTMSGGNQQKAIFARWLLLEPRLWLLDDATRGVDIGARRDLHKAVRIGVRNDGGAAALLVSSDVLELFEVCDRIVVFRDGAVVAQASVTDITPDEVEGLATGALAGMS